MDKVAGVSRISDNLQKLAIDRREGHDSNHTLGLQKCLHPLTSGRSQTLSDMFATPSLNRVSVSREQTHSKLTPKLIPNPGCHLPHYPTPSQTQELLEIEVLRQNREPLEDTLRKFWWPSSGRNEPEFWRVKGNGRPHRTLARELEPPPEKVDSSGLGSPWALSPRFASFPLLISTICSQARRPCFACT